MRRQKVVVIGAGISGLLVAYFAAKKDHRVLVFEKASHPGGLLQTQQTPYGLVETAANGLLNSRSLELLVKDLGIETLVPRKESRKRYIYVDGKARRWPLRWGQSCAFGFGVLRALLSPRGQAPRAGETVAQWATRTLGVGALNSLVAPALNGIYAGDVSRMSASLVFGRMFGKVRSGTRPKGTVSFQMGMGELTSALKKFLLDRGVEFHFGSSYQVPEVRESPHVICVGVHQLPEVFSQGLPEELQPLREVEMLPLVSVTQFFDRGPLVKGFGCLFADGEQFQALGVLMNSEIFTGRARENLHSETWILGGLRSPEIVEKSDREIREIIDHERKRLGGTGEAVHRAISRWSQALPHYTVEWEKCLARLDEQKLSKSGLFLCGNYLGQIGLSAILSRAESIVDRLEEYQ